MLFLDWEKAFDKISHTGLRSALEKFGVDPMYIRIIDSIYHTPQFAVRANGKLSTTQQASTGIRQGCPLSPYLFLFVHSTIMNEVDELVHQQLGHHPWVHSAKTPISQLAYADDTLIISRALQLAQELSGLGKPFIMVTRTVAHLSHGSLPCVYYNRSRKRCNNTSSSRCIGYNDHISLYLPTL